MASLLRKLFLRTDLPEAQLLKLIPHLLAQRALTAGGQQRDALEFGSNALLASLTVTIDTTLAARLATAALACLCRTYPAAALSFFSGDRLSAHVPAALLVELNATSSLSPSAAVSSPSPSTTSSLSSSPPSKTAQGLAYLHVVFRLLRDDANAQMHDLIARFMLLAPALRTLVEPNPPTATPPLDVQRALVALWRDVPILAPDLNRRLYCFYTFLFSCCFYSLFVFAPSTLSRSPFVRSQQQCFAPTCSCAGSLSCRCGTLHRRIPSL
jgi:hypothetical protein